MMRWSSFEWVARIMLDEKSEYITQVNKWFLSTKTTMQQAHTICVIPYGVPYSERINIKNCEATI